MTLIQAFQLNEKLRLLSNQFRGVKLKHIPEAKNAYAPSISGFDTITAELMKHRNTLEFLHLRISPNGKEPYPFSTTSSHFSAVANGKYVNVEHNKEVHVVKVKLSKNQVHVLIKAICDIQVFVSRIITNPHLPDYIGVNGSAFDYTSIIELLGSSLTIMMETMTLISEQYIVGE